MSHQRLLQHSWRKHSLLQKLCNSACCCSGCDQSSASPKPAAKAASQAAAQGAETAVVAPAGLPRRVPLSSKGMSSQNWAARQHKKASRGARQALAFLYPKGELHGLLTLIQLGQNIPSRYDNGSMDPIGCAFFMGLLVL